MMPSHISVGGVSGLSIVLANFVPLSVSAITMFFNVTLLIIGFLTLGKEFGIKTVYTSLLIPTVMGILEGIYPNLESLTGDAFVDMVSYCFFVGIGMAMLFNRNASSGGLDIVAKIANKYLHMEIGNAVFIAGMCVAVSSIFAYDIRTVIISVLGTYLNGLLVDRFIFGSTQKKRVCIISQKEEEIRKFIVNELHSGATLYNAYGAFDERKYREIIAIVDKTEYVKLMNFLAKTDKDAFVTIYAVNDVIYRPKVLKK
ncbi:MAG: YitT family protein [Lachnospiraceae bacterium]|nr:YitT family protein [Lachnospiraceae bacterium]